MQHPKKQHGVTLIELILTISVLSIALLGVFRVLVPLMEQGADPLWQSKVTEISQAYLDEILSRRFDENSPAGGVPACNGASCTLVAAFGGTDAGEIRNTTDCTNSFDDVDDYDGISDEPPLMFNGVASATNCKRENYIGYKVEVAVSYVGTQLLLSNNTDAKLIQLTITPPSGSEDAVIFSAIKGNF